MHAGHDGWLPHEHRGPVPLCGAESQGQPPKHLGLHLVPFSISTIVFNKQLVAILRLRRGLEIEEEGQRTPAARMASGLGHRGEVEKRFARHLFVL